MTRIAPVYLMYNPKVLWFDANDLDIPVGAPVVVATARGTEYGHLADPIFEATPEQLAGLKSELKPVLRLGTDADAAAAEEAQALSLAAMPVFRELAAEDSPEMRPIAVEYLLTCDKAVFYFEAENRIDFRELVRKLASRLHVRVDMRQIGSRDEARMMGGLGHCGQELCCKRLGGEFAPVSIRMAKEQNLSLNPQKISGLCGKLMCCLRYEYEAYKDFHARSPKVGDTISTPAGPAKVVDLDVPREVLTLLCADDKKVKIALADMVTPEDEGKPTAVDEAAWEETISGVSTGGVFEAAYLVNKFTAESQLGTPAAVRHTKPKDVGGAGAGTQKQGAASASAGSGAGEKGKPVGEKGKRSKAKSTGKGTAAPAVAADSAAAQPTATTVHRRRRGEGRQVDTGTSAAPSATVAVSSAEASRPAGNRPGQKSSGLARGRAAAAEASAASAAPVAKAEKAAKPAKQKTQAKSDGADKQQKAPQAKGKQQGKGQPQQQGKGQPQQQAKGQGNGKSAKQQAPAKQKAAKPAENAATAATAATAASPKRREPRRRVRVDTTE